MDEWLTEICWLVIAMFTFYIIRVTIAGASFLADDRLDGKVVIVTGANSGIGYETALELTKRGALVILACRSMKRGMEAESQIRKETHCYNARFRILDLSSFRSIRSFVKTIAEEEKCLYALINNAGVFWCDYATTQDGFESNFGVNYLGHFLLTLLLIPLLSKCPSGGRIVTVSSIMHIFGRIDLKQLNVDRQNYNFVKAYSDSKLAGVMFTKELVKRLPANHITAYCADPGIVSTNIGRESMLMGSYFFRVLLLPIRWFFFKSPSEGSQTVLYCVCSDRVLKYNGSCFSECEHRGAWASASDEHSSAQLWLESIRLTNLSNDDLKFLL